MAKKEYVLLTILSVIIASASLIVVLRFRDDNSISTTQTPAGNSSESQETEPMQDPGSGQFTVDKAVHSLSDPTSIWAIVNKKRGIPTSYKPELVVPNVRLRLSSNSEQMQISQTIQNDVEEMFDGAQREGVTLVFGSGYRSSAKQQQFYSSYVARDGKVAADTYSARPGHSEHQTGFAFDATSPSGKCHLEICFASTVQGKWLAENAHKYGFVIRYLDGKESITGYQYEPWHLRFIGKEAAAEVYSSGQTLEEYFNLEPAPSYD